MPHVMIDYSAPLQDHFRLKEITARVHAVLAQSGLFSLRDIKTRACPMVDFLVGEEGRDGAFVHVIIFLLEGRDVDKKAALARSVHEVLTDLLGEGISLSVDIRDLERAVYQKN